MAADPLDSAKGWLAKWCAPDKPLAGPVAGYAASIAQAYALVAIAESLRSRP